MDFNALKKSVGLEAVAQHIGVTLDGNRANQPCLVCGGSRSLKTASNKEFHCFKCGARGSIYDLLLLTKKAKDFREAHQILIKLVGKSGLLRQSTGSYNLNEVFNAYQECYKRSPEVVDNYCQSRGWTDKIEVGYAADHNTLATYSGLSTDQLTELELYNVDYGEYYKNYAVFPVRNFRGDVVHLCGRALGSQSLRWKSTKGKPPISDHFYNLNALINPSSNYIVVCEGISDCLSLLQIGVPAIAQFGVNVKLSRYAEQFSNFEHIIFVYDCDKYPLGSPYAGKYKSWSQMMPEVIDLVSCIKKNTYYLQLPDYSGVKDINDWLVKVIDYDQEEFQRYTSNHYEPIEALATKMYGKDSNDHHLLWRLFKATNNRKAAQKFYNDNVSDPIDYLFNLNF